MSEYIRNQWYQFYLNVADMRLLEDLTFTKSKAVAIGISPTQLVDPTSSMTGVSRSYGFALNMRSATSGSLIYKYNLPSGTVVRAAVVDAQQFKIIDYRLPDSGLLPIKSNTALNFFPSVIVDSTTGPIVLSLPSSSGSGWIGQTFSIQKIDTSINSIFISGILGDKIDGQSTYEITHPFESVKILSNGSGWYTI